MVGNEAIAKRLRELGWLYDAKGDRYRAMSFGRAASHVEKWPEEVEVMKDVTAIHGVGDSIGAVINEIVKTGTCKRLETMKAESPPVSVSEFEEMRGVGPKSALQIWKQYSVATMSQLGRLIEEGKVEAKLVKMFEAAKAAKRVPREAMLGALTPVLDELKTVSEIQRIEVAGSLRRGIAWVKDADVVVCCAEENRVQVFKSVQNAVKNASDGSVKVGGEIEVNGDLRHVDVSLTVEESWGACWMYLTGSKEHNVLLRQLAKTKGMTLNEYGLWRDKEMVAGKTEIDIYQALGVPWFEPHEREAWVMKGKISI